MITGDHIATAIKVAKDVGIVKEEELEFAVDGVSPVAMDGS